MDINVFLFVGLFLIFILLLVFIIKRKQLALIFSHKTTIGENIGTEVRRNRYSKDDERVNIVKIQYTVDGHTYTIEQTVALFSKGEYKILYNPQIPSIATTISGLLALLFYLALIIVAAIFFISISF